MLDHVGIVGNARGHVRPQYCVDGRSVAGNARGQMQKFTMWKFHGAPGMACGCSLSMCCTHRELLLAASLPASRPRQPMVWRDQGALSLAQRVPPAAFGREFASTRERVGGRVAQNSHGSNTRRRQNIATVSGL